MAFIARIDWEGAEPLGGRIIDCIREHSAARLRPEVIGSGGFSAAAVAPSRAERLGDGTLVLVSGRPQVPGAGEGRSEAQAIHALYLEHGAALAGHIGGSFGLAILDPNHRRCVAVRDRLGFVPLFYAADREGLWVGDTLKPILASRSTYFSLDHEAIYRYIYLKAFESPDTVLREVKTLRPGFQLQAHAKGLRDRRYWDIPIVPVGDEPVARDTDHLEAALAAAVERGIGPSRPAGVMVSGGLDSGVLSALTARAGIRPAIGINVAFESRWSDIDESWYAQAVADACDIPLTKVEFTQERLVEALPVLWWNNHLPTANSGFKLNLIGLQTYEAGSPTTFMLGEGADTLLLYGWNWKYFDRIHALGRLAQVLPDGLRHQTSGAMERFFQQVQTSRLRNDITGILRGYLAANLGYLKWKGSVIRPEAIDRLFAPALRERVGFRLLSRVFGEYFEGAPADGLSEKLVYASLKSYIPNQQLMNYHTACNYFGAELACPYADEAVAELCLRLPWHRREDKRILKEVAERWLPHHIVHREKCAFLMPMTEWIKTRFWPLVETVFSREIIEQRGLFDPRAMADLKESFQAGTFRSWPDIWTFVVLEAWLRINLDAATPACPASIEEVFPEIADGAAVEPRRRSA